MKKDKLTLVIIVVLFIVFVGMGIYGTVLLSSNDDDLVPEGALVFYSNDNEIIGSYECIYDNCGYALSSDEEYIDYYYESSNNVNLGIINGDYTLLQDGEEIFLYAISLGVKMLNFDEIKYYDTINNKNYVLVKLNGQWGAISLANLSRPIEIVYDELSIGDNVIDGVHDGSKLVAKYDMFYFILDNENNVLSTEFTDKIVYYNENSIITYDQLYKVTDYEGNTLISFDLSYFTKSESYYLFVYNNYVLIYDNLNDDFLEFKEIADYEDIVIEDYENSYKIYIDGEELV